jgi:hypothetical protein
MIILKYSFDELKKDLEIGHEVEFYYLDGKYSISSNKDGWYLTRFEDGSYQSYKNPDELLEYATINSSKFKDIWDNVVIDSVF